eukprot:526008_1
MSYKKMAEQKSESKQSDYSHIHRKLAALRGGGFPMGSDIPMQLAKPLQPNYAHLDGTVELMTKSAKNVMETSKNPGLAHFVTSSQMKNGIKDISENVLQDGHCVYAAVPGVFNQNASLKSFPHEPLLSASENAKQDVPQNQWVYKIEQEGGRVASAVMTLLSDQYFDKFSKGYMVGYNHEENTYAATHIDAIKTTLTSVGSLIGNLQNGEKVDAQQVTNLIADSLTNLGNTKEDHWHKDTGFSILFAVHDDLGGKAAAVCGVKWRYQATVDNVSKCCTTTYNSWYSIQSRCCVFFDFKTLQDQFKQVTGKNF